MESAVADCERIAVKATAIKLIFFIIVCIFSLLIISFSVIRCSLKLYSFQVLFLISECKITANPVCEQKNACFSSLFVATQALYCDNSRILRRYLSQRGTGEVREVTFGGADQRFAGASFVAA